MNLVEFFHHYPDESSCKSAFKSYRDQQGVVCKKCYHTVHYWKGDKEQYECKRCGFRTTLRSGTVMQNSKLPYQYWFIAMHLMSSTKKSISALEMQRQLGHKRYEPIWAMMHKIRSVMGLRDNEYVLSGSMEIDEGFFETVKKKAPTLKRGRGSEKQTTVLVLAESEEVATKRPGRPARKCGFVKLKVIRNLKAETINEKVKNHTCNADAITDGYKSYNHLLSVVDSHKRTIVEPKQAGKLMPWVHITISNAKRLFLNTFHRIDDDFLENYLNEFCFKLNRRYFNNLFDRVLVAAVNYRWDVLR